ncbi:hypothetical protein V4V51_003904 [Vibrio mimicus]
MQKFRSALIAMALGALGFYCYSLVFHSEWFTKIFASIVVQFFTVFKPLSTWLEKAHFTEISLLLSILGSISLSLFSSAILVLIVQEVAWLKKNAQYVTLGVLLCSMVKLLPPIIVNFSIGAVAAKVNLAEIQVNTVVWYLPFLVVVFASMLWVRKKSITSASRGTVNAWRFQSH